MWPSRGRDEQDATASVLPLKFTEGHIPYHDEYSSIKKYGDMVNQTKRAAKQKRACQEMRQCPGLRTTESSGPEGDDISRRLTARTVEPSG